MLRIKQKFDRPLVADIAQSVHAALEKLTLGGTIKAGHTVALTAGSRGIANIPLVLKSLVQHLKDLGAKPFLVPAMGSHGGGLAAGQQKVLESYGITEAYVGAPIRASMEVVSLGATAEGFPVLCDKHALAADHIGVVARIKPHTSYHGPIESGWLKMMMIGLGKHQGALQAHKILLEQPYDVVVRSITKMMRAKAPIAFGLGVVENAYDETGLIDAALPADFETVEERMLVKAKEWLAKLPFAQADLLIVDEIGKEISGAGMDTNVVGRKKALGSAGPRDQPDMRFIFVRGLSPHTHGNASGIGMADFTTSRLVKGMDYKATVINCLTAGYPVHANTPVHYDTDREVLDSALAILGTRAAEKARVIHIKNTLAVEEVEISEACLAELPQRTEFSVTAGPFEMKFDGDGNLTPVM